MSLLILGSSHARRLGRNLQERGREESLISAAGIPGGRLMSERHRIWLLTMAKARRPKTVVLMLGGNDLSARDFDLPSLSTHLSILGLGLLALGVENVWVLPILPRSTTRPVDVSPQRYEQRRLATNRIWSTRFRRAPVTMINAEYPPGTIGRDGVHLSARGEEAVLEIVRGIH